MLLFLLISIIYICIIIFLHLYLYDKNISSFYLTELEQNINTDNLDVTINDNINDTIDDTINNKNTNFENANDLISYLDTL